MNTEERQLSDLLHRVTPEPPRGVTVEDVAIRMANQAGRQPRVRRTFRGSPHWGRAWAPVLAAASVFVVAGASAGIAVLASAHHAASPGTALSTASTSTTAAASQPTTSQSSRPGSPIPGGPWEAELINHDSFLQGSLTGSGDSLYALTGQDLVRIDPATGDVTASVPSGPSLLAGAPVVLGSTVWVVWSYGGATVVLRGYDAQTLAPVASVSVPVVGQVSDVAQGVLTAGTDGHLYLAAGDGVAVVNTATDAVVKRIQLGTSPVNSVAVSPDGSTLYASTSANQIFHVVTYDLTSGVEARGLTVPGGTGGNLVATSGGVWGSLGIGTTEWVWFAPAGDPSSYSRVAQGGGGFDSLPALADGAVWVGGSSTLACANPDTGRVLATAAIPADGGSAQYFGSVTYAGGYAYSYYIDDRSQLKGLARISPPAGCALGS